MGAHAISSPSGTEVNLAGLKLIGDSTSSGSETLDRSQMISSPIGNTSMNNTSINDSLINDTLINEISMNKTSIEITMANSSQSTVRTIDLSHYASDRLSRDLIGYKNIQYPMAESSGFTASAAGGGGGCCGGG